MSVDIRKALEKEILKEFNYNKDPEKTYGRTAIYLDERKGSDFILSLQAKSNFLSLINMPLVKTTSGKKLYGGTERGITGRVFTENFAEFLCFDSGKYQLASTDSNIFLTWDLLDNLALEQHHLLPFFNNYFKTQICLDMLQIAWVGKRIAPQTQELDLSDVNKGWLGLLAEQKPENYLTQGKHKRGNIKIFGEDADFSDLNELALSLKEKLHIRHQNRNDLVFLVGSELIAKSNNVIIDNVHLGRESELEYKKLLSNFGGLPTIIPPQFPSKCAVVTSLKNLSIYTQAATQLISYRNVEDLKRLNHKYYREEGYVVEDLSLIAAIDYTKVILN